MRRYVTYLLILIAAGLPALAQPARKPETAAALLAEMQARAARMRDYTVDGESERDGKTSHFKLYFKQPDLVRVDTSRGQVTVEPTGEIRGRLGKGPLGDVSRKVARDDRRLRDKDGVPFWETHYAATVAGIESRIKAGATATVAMAGDAYNLNVRSGRMEWRYVIDPGTLFFRETSTLDGGRQVEVTHYSDFHPNVGLDAHRFEF